MEEKRIFTVNTTAEFENLALEIFQFQYKNVDVYRSYVDLLKIDPNKVRRVDQIPFLPIQFFKNRQIIAKGLRPEVEFTSSGTTGSETSRHYVAKVDIYKQSFTMGFRYFYGSEQQYCILALLPAYLERTGSSLVYMVDGLIRQSGNPNGGFYLNQLDELAEKLTKLDSSGQKCLLVGVSFALLDLAERHKFNLKNTIVMETGGMKGRRKEMVRDELHGILAKAFGVDSIHSEYGMTELLSQAYSKGKGVFSCPPWMRVLIRETTDPFTIASVGTTGGINIIDLSNLYSCAFIQTQDLGRLHHNGTFEVLGRMDSAPIRGCNLLVYG
ncbi:MAG TPA: acyl transferase [Bacteroidales bacterium]|nr:acyl transferase [Bacteroidales bacterium]